MRRNLRTTARTLAVAAAAIAMGTPAGAYYHYVHYLTRTGPFTPIYEKFNLAALPNKTVSIFVSDAGPKTAADFGPVLAQVKEAAAVWNAVATSDLRVAFGGLESANQKPATPGIDVVFEELAPGILAEAGPMAPSEVPAGAEFVPIASSILILNSNTALPPGPVYAETYFTTAVHEVGHALGLQHTFTAGAMSQAVIRNTTRTRPLDDDDVAAVSTLYGKPGWKAAFGSIAGTVTSNGQGVSLASVVALPNIGSPVSALTNPDGTYRIDGIPPGPYILYVHPLPPGADIRPPMDATGQQFAASQPFGTLFSRDGAGIADYQADTISVEAGKTVEGRDFAVQPRAAVPIYDVVTFSYFDSDNQTYSWVGNPVTPAFVDAVQSKTDGWATITLQSTSGSTPVPRSAAILGGFAAPQVGPCCGDSAVVVYFTMPRMNPGVGPRHLILNFGDDIYVMPQAINLIRHNPPAITSVTANEDGSVTVAGRNMGPDSRVFFDGLQAAAAKPFSGDDAEGSVAVFPPPGFGEQKASVTVYNADGQNSLTLQSVDIAYGNELKNPPPAYQYPVAGVPGIVVTPAVLPAGALAKVEVTAENMRFVNGEVTLGFGSSDVSLRGLWVLSPTRLIANVAVAPNAPSGTSAISVISGFQVAAQPGAFELLPRDSRQPAIALVANGVPTQATIYPGGYATIYGSNLAVSGVTPRITLNEVAAWVEYYSPTQINLVVPADLPTGPATLKLDTGAGNALPLVVQIAPPPPVIGSVKNSSGQPLDAEHAAFTGEMLAIQVTGLDGAVLANPGRLRVTLGGVEMKVAKILELGDGLFEIQIELTGTLPAGSAPLAVWVDGSSSAPKNIPLQ
jgi:uncharacterized protein (TIGR03437 family)